MSVPDWYETLLLSLAAFRLWRLISEDDILDRPRRRLLRLGDEWQEDGDPVPDDYRSGLASFLTCPWCSGAWLAGAWWLAWLAFDEWATGLAVPLAMSATVGIVRGRLDPPDE